MLKIGLGIAACAVLIGSSAADEGLSRDVKAHYDAQLGDLFRHFHSHPELSFRETETAKRLAAELRALGVEVTEGVGRTGLVGVIENGSGPTVMIRADMDGLPIKERTNLAYASTATGVSFIDGRTKPVMHACGHDSHMTALVGTAKALMDRRDQWSGTLVLVGQPAEECCGGARAMIDDGLFTRFPKPDVALAFHVASPRLAGTVRVEPATAYSSVDSVDVLIKGVGSHGASPHTGVDPIVMGAQMVEAFQTLVSRTIPPLESGVVTVGAFQAGTKHNIIPEEATLLLTVRADTPAVREALIAGIRRIAEGVARTNGLEGDMLPEVTVTESTPATINDADLAARMTARFTEHFGADRIDRVARDSMVGEDFSEFIRPQTDIPGLNFFVGGTPQDELERAPPHHSPLFKIAPEPAITTAVEAFVVAVLDLMGPDGAADG